MSDKPRPGLEEQPDWVQKQADTLFKGVQFDKLPERQPIVTQIPPEQPQQSRSKLIKIIEAGKPKI